MKWAWLGVGLAALAVRTVALFAIVPELKPDVDLDYYRSVARSVANGDGFCVDGVPNVARTPVYPLFLAGLMRLGGDRLGWFLAAQCLLGAITSALVVRLARHWLSPVPATIAGLLVAFDPNSVVRCLDLRTEILFTALLTTGTWLLVKDRWAWAGFVWSLAALCRPIAVFLPVVAATGWLTQRPRPARLVWLTLCFAPLLLLWMARNAQITGQWFVSSISTINLLHYHAAALEAEPLDQVQARYLREFGSAEFCEDRAAFAARLRAMRQQALAVIAANPVTMARQMTIGCAKIMFGPGARSLESSLRQPARDGRWWVPAYIAALLLLWVAAGIGAVALGRTSALLVALVI